MSSPAIRGSAAVLLLAISGPPVRADTLDGSPSSGVALPAAPLAGDVDGRVVSTNPGGLTFVDGAEFALAIDAEDKAVAASSGGTGAYLAFAGGGSGILPRFGLGLGFEWLRAAHGATTVDPGTPFRFTLSSGQAIGKHFGYGVSWHHTSDDGRLDGLNTFDYGVSGRASNYLAIGGVIRDITAPKIGDLKINRRYELEAVLRPTGTSAFEVAGGGRIEESTHDVDLWGRMTAKLARGLYAHAAVESRAVHRTDDLGVVADGRELRATLGLEVSFGGAGVTALATGIHDDKQANHPLGGQLLLTSSAAGVPSVLGRADHVEKVEIADDVSLRDTTAIVRRLREIGRDPTVKAVIVEIKNVAAGAATLQELRNELLALRKSGKKVFAHALSVTQGEYFLASAADKVYLDPAGDLELLGVNATLLYLRGAFDHLGINPQYEKIGEYKSAPEMETETKATPAAAKMMNELVDSIWDQWVAQVAASRRISAEELKGIVDNGPYTAGDLSANAKLVDAIVTPNKVEDLVRAELGRKLPVTRPAPERAEKWKRPQVAVIYIDGDIGEGKSRAPLPIPLVGDAVAGADTLTAAIKAAREDASIGAIVLRIDSPGGTALASELVSREVFATRGVKPIVCSVGDVAASGAYFIAAGCDRIYAEPMAITGSIGVYGGKRDISGLLAKIGVTTESYQRGKRAHLESPYRPWTDEERAVLLEKMRYTYGRFVGAVAEGRKLTKDGVDAIGRGHVYSGDQAAPIKLVDAFGGLNAAIDDATQHMGLAPATKVELVELPRIESSLLGPFGALAGAKAKAQLASSIAPLLEPILRGIPTSVLIAPDAVQARLPFDLVWK